MTTFENDYRADAAQYYEKYSKGPPGDITFYEAMVDETTRVLELGCGTGRVLIPLARKAGCVFGLDASAGMLEICRQKLAAENLDTSVAEVERADICDFDLMDRRKKFDLIVAPFRVMQNLESDEQVNGFMHGIRRHLAPEGKAVINAFRPRGNFEELKKYWDARDGNEAAWSEQEGEFTVSLYDVCNRYAQDPLRVFPDLIYRKTDRDGKLVDEATLSIVMRVWFADELLSLIENHGFRITKKSGGYQGEVWDEGSEFVVEFQAK